MDKREFLKELGNYLNILEEQEQQDILNEYSQHIEMKMQKGMSEEEAIEDFGNLEVLAAEILSAYHIKLQEKTAGEHQKIHMILKKGKQWWKNAAVVVRECGHRVWKGMKWLVKNPVDAIYPLCKNVPWFRKKEKKQGDGNFMERYGFVKGIRNFIINAWQFCVRACFWCARWAFNLMILFIAAIAGVMALMCLFGFGVLFVLLLAGYPLIGITLACFGGLIMCGAFTMLVLLFIRLKKKDDEKEEVAVNA